MSQENGQYEHEPAVLVWIQERETEYPLLELLMQSENREGPLYRDTILIMVQHFGIDYEGAVARLHAWVEWNSYQWHIQCEDCGCGIEMDHFTSSHGCVCGATYVVDAWKEYHRDDTMGGRITTEVGECGTVIKTFKI